MFSTGFGLPAAKVCVVLFGFRDVRMLRKTWEELVFRRASDCLPQKNCVVPFGSRDVRLLKKTWEEHVFGELPPACHQKLV